jgi:4-amino-4-deoxy-L-arabinose transferase-like glycosyltransferase
MHGIRFATPTVAWRWLLALTALRLLLHVASNGEYGFHRDELQLWVDAQRLDWGYVAYPPLTAFLGRLGIELLGDSTNGLRLFAALAQAIAMLVAGLIARELGGQRMAQAVAALAVACTPVSMLQGSMLMYVGIEYLCVVLTVWMLLRVINGGDARWWLGVGVAIGLGMMTRYTMLFWAVGLAAGVVSTPLRRQLAGPWLWAGVALSLLVFAPNAWWQWRHDFVYLDFVEHIHARDVRIGRTDGFLVGQLLTGASPLIAPLWLAGLAWLVLSKAAARWRVLAWMYALPLLLFLLAQARDYYMAPGYPMLLAAGAVALEAGIARLRIRTARWSRAALALVLLAAFASTALVALPIAPINSAGWHISRSFHDNFAEQIGWPELVAQVAAVYHALPPEERGRTAIFANNYGEAGAIDRYGPAHGLPPAIGTINGYWYRGYGTIAPRTVIVLGDDAEGVSDTPATCTRASRVRIPHGVDNEESGHPEIFVCRDFRVPIHTLWPAGPSFG